MYKKNRSSTTCFALNTFSFHSIANFFDHIYISQTNLRLFEEEMFLKHL